MEHPIFPLSPRRLINLADMIKFFTSDFSEALTELGDFKCLATKTADQVGSGSKLNQKDNNGISSILNALRKHIDPLKLTESEGRIAAIGRRLVGYPKPCTYEVIIAEIESLQHSIWYEIERVKMVFVPPLKEPYFEQPALFGGAVRDSFPSAITDIKEAGNCLASGLNTAAVFHLVRSVEYGMRALSKHLKAKTKFALEYCDWTQVINAVESKLTTIKSQSRGKKKSDEWEFYSQALSDCKALLEPRNRVSHARGDFSEAEAFAVFERAKHLMQNLSTKIYEA